MSDNWVVQNLQNALDTWNKYLSEIWQLITQSPEQFKGGSIWGVIVNIHDAVRAIGLALLVLFFVVGVMRTCGSFAEVKKPEHALKLFIRFAIAKGVVTYTFIMIALYSGLRREEILGLQWDCVFLDVPTPYISVRRAWRSENNRPVISTTLKTKAARRDIPIPKCLTDCLREVKEKTESEYVVADRNGNPLSSSQFQRVWKYVTVRSTKPHNYYKYVNGQCVKCTVTPTPGSHQKNNPKLVYAIDFDVTPHQLRHTYITNLLYAGIDPKTVQYLAGHENSKTTMDIYAQVKYNKPEELLSVVNAAFAPSVGV